MSATVSGLAQEEPQHPPLFYLLDRAWAQRFGSSIADLRLPALLFGLAAMLAVSWFCFELTGSTVVAGSAAALMAVSPFFVNYSAQAREYTLWATGVSACSALLLQALRRPSALRWTAYAVAMALALYADVLMLAVLAGHVAFVFSTRYRDRRVLAGYASAAGIATALFLPWLIICIRARSAISADESWTYTTYPLQLFIEKWCFNIGSVLFDAEYGNMRLLAIAIAMMLLIVYAVVRMFRDEKPATAWFVAAPALTIALPALLIDVLVRAHASTEPRYLVPLWIALLVAVAVFFGRRITSDGVVRNVPWLAGFCVVLVLQAASSAGSSGASMWWDNQDHYPSTSIAERIDAAGPSPLVVSAGPAPEVLVMSHYVPIDSQFLLLPDHGHLPHHLKRDTFLLTPSVATLAELRAGSAYSITPIPVTELASAALTGFHRQLRSGAAASRPTPVPLFRIQERSHT